jgi:hypothetical protein
MATNRRLPSGLVNRFAAAPADLASLAAFRIMFGLLMALAMVRFILKGWVALYYVTPKFYFYYPGFQWIHPWPGYGMYVHYVALAVLAVGVAAGLFYRLCITLFFLGFTYVEMIDQTAYLNHYYLISLLCGLLMFVPAHRKWSIDAWRHPEIRADAAPAWCLNILRFQVAVVYIFAGLAKFNTDWLFNAQPLRIWLAARSDLPFIGPWLNESWVACAASWFGALFDTGIVFFLLWRRTRWIAFALLTLFHIATLALFNIGMFPWIMIAAATLLLPAGWPRQCLNKLYRLFKSGLAVDRATSASSAATTPRLAGARPALWVLSLLAIYAAVQLALPLRAYFEKEAPAWTCSGFNCAWRVMIVEKTGYAEFYACDPASGDSWKVPLDGYLTPRQETLMAQDPYLIREMARRLAGDLNKCRRRKLEIRVTAMATLNGRPAQLMINPEIDLATAGGNGWILPLTN